MTEERGSSQIERYAQHIVQAVTVAAIIFGAKSLTELQTADAITQVKLDTLQARINDFSARTQDRYTGAQALKDRAEVDETLRDFETRLRVVEKHVVHDELKEIRPDYMIDGRVNP